VFTNTQQPITNPKTNHHTMAENTAVNSQITDAINKATENTQASFPEKVLQLSHAFTQTLQMENAVFLNQMKGAIQLVQDAMQAMAALDTDVATKSKTALNSLVADMEAQLPANGQAAAKMATPARVAPNQNEQTLETILVQSVGESYKNAVTAQQQMYVTLQAATTMTISAIISIDTATIAAKAKQELS
jgi:hypothetical protein